ncbi:MAG TPA: DUF2252 domain-containing protein [Terriglobales bacterium]|nr:DUF2252 domain-containing protein [Terriglobales bacterium]
MAVAKLQELPLFDLGHKTDSWEKRRAEGKALRHSVPRESHAEWKPSRHRTDPVKTVMASNKGRQEHLIPLRMGRMASSPFAFLRGSACVMAADLSNTPISGIPTVMDGDAHLNNFGLYGTPQREVVFDLNDFDEAIVGPWEWDLKRLAASVNVAGRQNGLNRRERAAAVRRCVEGYRFNAHRLQGMGVLDVWYLHAYPGKDNPVAKMDAKSKAVFDKTVAKAMRTDNRGLLPKVADRGRNGRWTFREAPPVLTQVDKTTKQKVIKALNQYSLTLSRERRVMLGRYYAADVAHRVVGVGSVGTRAYLVLLFGNGDDDPLFLQVKEAAAAAHAPFVPPMLEEFRHNGKRVLVGQRALQASSDPMLGYTEIEGRDFYVRQMKNLKASVPIEWLTGSAFNFYAWACGAILARAHARTGDPARISGYCGNSTVLDEALASWAEAYGDQTEEDHAALVDAIRRGEVKADLSEGATD